jgi:hypothetical protein
VSGGLLSAAKPAESGPFRNDHGAPLTTSLRGADAFSGGPAAPCRGWQPTAPRALFCLSIRAESAPFAGLLEFHPLASGQAGTARLARRLRRPAMTTASRGGRRMGPHFMVLQLCGQNHELLRSPARLRCRGTALRNGRAPYLKRCSHDTTGTRHVVPAKRHIPSSR